MQKRGEKGMFGASWSKRWFTLVWSESNLAEREMRYFETRDYCTRKQKGAIDLSQAALAPSPELRALEPGPAQRTRPADPDPEPTPDRGAEQATEVNAVEIEGQRGITIKTPGRLWELLPASGEEAAEWLKILHALMARKRGLAVVSSFSNMALTQIDGMEEQRQFEMTIVLTRKLGMAINKARE